MEPQIVIPDRIVRPHQQGEKLSLEELDLFDGEMETYRAGVYDPQARYSDAIKWKQTRIKVRQQTAERHNADLILQLSRESEQKI